ncbi:precorrin-6y C5,15-methyltransferase (decarboxylating) subunit CbiE [Tessaracoccus sp. G1721]
MPHRSPAAARRTSGRVIVVGVSADGVHAVSEELAGSATLVVGAARHLELLPPVPGQLRLPLPSPLRAGLVEIVAAHPGATVVVLASGDPLVSGIGSVLIDLLGPDGVEIRPAVSSVALARAAMRWPAESHGLVSVVGRDVSLVLRELAPGRRLLVLSSDETTPRLLGALLVESGYGSSRLTVLGNLGGDDSRLDLDASAAALRADFPRLNIVAIECVGALIAGWTAGVPDTLVSGVAPFLARDVRAAALALLGPVPGGRLWDIGPGAGPVAVEWLRAHPTCAATAVVPDAAATGALGDLAARLGVPGLSVAVGTAPSSLADLPAPDAVHLGPGAAAARLAGACLGALRPGGRLVAHAVDEGEAAELEQLQRRFGGDLARVTGEVWTPSGWVPGHAVTRWALSPA